MKYVLGLLFDSKKEFICLIEKTKPEWQKGLWNGIGGKIEQGETPYDAMNRETFEECGLLIDWNHLISMYENTYEMFVYYSYSDNIWNAKTLENEIIKIFPIDQLPKCVDDLEYFIKICSK